MRIKIFFLLFVLSSSLSYCANIDYRSLSTNDFFTNRPSANYVSVNTNRFPSATTITNMILNNLTGGAATNVVVRASTNIFITTNGPTDWTFATTPPLWTNVPSSADIVNTNWYQNVNVIAASLVVSNGGSVGGPLTILDIRNTNNSRIILRSIGEVAGGAQQKIFQYLDGGVETFVFMNDGDLAKLRGVNMHWPTTNGGAGQVLAQDGANPQNWYYTNLFVGTLTNGSSSFWATNVSGTNATFITINVTTNNVNQLFVTNINGTPATNWLLSGITNNNGVFGNGQTNYFALFRPNTNTVTSGIMYQVSSNQIVMEGTNATLNSVTQQIVGARVSATSFHSMMLKGPEDGNHYGEVWCQSGSVQGANDIMLLNKSVFVGAAIPNGGQQLGGLSPAFANELVGSTSALWHGMYSDTAGFIASPTTPPSGNFSSIGGYALSLGISGVDVISGDGADFARFTRNGGGSGNAQGLDIGANWFLMGGNVLGTPTTFIWMPATGIVQIGTNNQGAAVIADTNIITGIKGSGTDSAGGSLFISGGPTTGTGLPGNVGFKTGTNSATSGSSARGLQNRAYISAHQVTLTESSATLVFNVALTAKQNVGIHVFSTTTADDGTDFQSRTEDFVVSAVNKAGTVSTGISASGNTALAESAGASTLATTWTAVANGNGVDIKCSAVSSLTQSTLEVRWMAELNGNGPLVLTPQ